MFNCKHASLLLMALLMLMSCEKATFDKPKGDDPDVPIHNDDPENPPSGDSDVCTLDVKIAPFSLISSAYSGEAKLQYVLYDSIGNQFRSYGQSVVDDDFGHLTYSLKPGEYSLLVVGHSQPNPVIENLQRLSYDSHVVDTYAAVASFRLAKGESRQLPIALKCLTACLRVKFDAPVPNNLRSLRVEFSNGDNAVNPSTGFAIDDKASLVFCPIDETQWGSSDYTATFFRFLNTDSEEMNVTINAIDKGGEYVFGKVERKVILSRGTTVDVTFPTSK